MNNAGIRHWFLSHSQVTNGQVDTFGLSETVRYQSISESVSSVLQGISNGNQRPQSVLIKTNLSFTSLKVVPLGSARPSGTSLVHSVRMQAKRLSSLILPSLTSRCHPLLHLGTSLHSSCGLGDVFLRCAFAIFFRPLQTSCDKNVDAGTTTGVLIEKQSFST